MTLYTLLVDEDFKDWVQFDKLNKEAFPNSERMDIEETLRNIHTKGLEVWAVYEKERFIGFYELSKVKSVCYLSFLAVDKQLRGKGYGKSVLSLIKQTNSNFCIVLDIEKINNTEANNEQRKTRKKFYLNNGYYETGYFLLNNGVKTEILCSNKKFPLDDFRCLIKELKDKRFQFQLFYGTCPIEEKESETMETKQKSEIRELDSLYKKMDNAYHDLATKIGFSNSAFLVLYSIVELGGGCVQTDISKKYSISPQTLSSSIHNLEKEGYIYLEQGYGRNMKLFLTPLGKRFAKKIVYPLMSSENEVFNILTPDEVACLLHLTHKYIEILTNQIKNLSLPKKEEI